MAEFNLIDETDYPKLPPTIQADNSANLLTPYKLNSGTLRGTQIVGFGAVKIDGSNNRIVLTDTTDGDVMTVGDIGTSDLGISVKGSSNNDVVTLGNIESSNLLGMAVNDGTRDVLKIGDLGSSYIGLTASDAANDRIFIGKNTSGSYVAKLSQSGYDAKTATDDQLIWSSDFNLFKIVSTITGSISGDNNSASGLWKEISNTTAHGLSGTPIVLGFVVGSGADHPSEARIMPNHVYFSSASAFPYQMFISAHSDSTNVYVRLHEGPSVNWAGQTVTYKLYLLKETAA